MFTINIKGKANPKDPKMVKLEMIIFKTGYARVTTYSGAYPFTFRQPIKHKNSL